MATTVKIEGADELNRELEKLAKPATRKASARRALKNAAKPLVSSMRSNAPVRAGHLLSGIDVSTKAVGGDAGKAAFASALRSGGTRQDAVGALRDARRAASGSVNMFVGPGRHPQAITQEFGTWFHPPQPFVRPAWDSNKSGMLEQIKKDLWSDIQKSVARAERRAARLAAQG